MKKDRIYAAIKQAKRDVEYFISNPEFGFYHVPEEALGTGWGIEYNISRMKEFLNFAIRNMYNDSMYMKIAHNVVLYTGNFYEGYTKEMFMMPRTENCMEQWHTVEKNLKKKRRINLSVWKEIGDPNENRTDYRLTYFNLKF